MTVACGTLLVARPLDSVLYEAWATFSAGPVVGQVSLQQVDAGATTISAVLSTVPTGAALSMTILQQATGVAGGCPSPATVFDPARASATTCAGTANLASCAAGDLVGKFGTLPTTGGTTVRAVYTDATLAVLGRQGVLGRTLRLAWTGGEVCATITSSTMTATFYNGTTSFADDSGIVVARTVGGGVSLAPAPGGGVLVAVTVRQGLTDASAYSVNIERTSAGTTATGCPATADLYDPYEYVNQSTRGGRGRRAGRGQGARRHQSPCAHNGGRGQGARPHQSPCAHNAGRGRGVRPHQNPCAHTGARPHRSPCSHTGGRARGDDSQVTGLYASRCTATTPDGCAAGALTAKADPAWTVSTAGSLDFVYVDRQLSLVDVSGRAIVVRNAASGEAVACALVAPYTVSGTTALEATETTPATPIPFFETAAGGITILVIVLLSVLVVAAIALVVMRHYNFDWLPSRWRAPTSIAPAATARRGSDRRSSSTEGSNTSTTDLVGRRGAPGNWTLNPLTS